MTDQTPPKPKPGSLRDRIAAFEKGGASTAPPPPAPRPKPAGFSSWKPKAPSPPSSPGSSSAGGAVNEHSSTSMSASDAKDSIVKAGSLKERMAALQGKGAFGAPSPPALSPKPAVEKPKWKPPPVVQAPKDDDDEEVATAGQADVVKSPPTSVKSPPPGSIKSLDSEPTATPSAEDEDATQPISGEGEQPQEELDPEEEERQRRAAIAARMARLGGARLGMAPPVFGKKPVPAPKPKAEVSAPAVEESNIASPKPEPAVPSPATVVDDNAAKLESSSIIDDAAKVASPPPVEAAASSKSPEPSESAEAAAKAQSMPVPAVPRRAAPPRRKPAKSVPTPTAEDETPAVPASDAAEPKQDEPTEPEEEELLTGEPPLDLFPSPERAHSSPPVDLEISPDLPAGPEPALATPHIPAITRQISLPEKAPVLVPMGDFPTPVESVLEEEYMDLRSGEEERAKVADDRTPTGGYEEDVEDEEEEEKEEEVHARDTSPVEEQREIPHLPTPPSFPPASPPSAPHATSSPVPISATEDVVQAADEDAEEDSEETRRRRMSEKMAKMGGINQFGMQPSKRLSSSDSQPRRSESGGSVTEPQRKASLRKSSVDSPHPVPTGEEQDVAAAAPAILDQVTEEPVSVEPVASAEEEEEEEVEAARRKRVAEKLAKMGGVNPLAPPPMRRPSASTSSDDVSALSPPHRQPSVSQEQHGESRKVPEEDEEDEEEEEEIAEDKADKAAADDDYDSHNHNEQDYKYEEDEEADDDERGEEDDEAPPPNEEVEAPFRESEADMEREAANNRILSRSRIEAGEAPPEPPVRVLHPPRRFVPHTPEEEQEDEREEEEDEEDVDEDKEENLESSTLFLPPSQSHSSPSEQHHSSWTSPPRLRMLEESDTEPIPIPHRTTSVGDSYYNNNNTDSDAEFHSSSILHRPIPNRSIPRPPPQDSSSEADQDQYESDYSEALPTRPRRSVVGTPANDDIPLIIPPPNSLDTMGGVTPTSLRPPHIGRPLPTPGPGLSSEVLDEEEGDPIDPSFHSPSRRASTITLPATGTSPPVPAAPPPAAIAHAASDENEGDPEQSRRRTIAERMAKLGGIKFGAAPMPTPVASQRPSENAQEDSNNQPEDGNGPAAEDPTDLTEEEEERARKARIAAKLAGMGGMRIGMLPSGMLQQRSYALKEETVSPPPPPPPQRAVPPSRPPPPSAPSHEDDSEHESADDGVKVEAEESEIEELNYDDAQEVEVPPPVPARTPKRQSTSGSIHSERPQQHPPVPGSRPPVPATSLPRRQASIGTAKSPTRSASGDSAFSHVQRQLYQKPQSEYVMVDEPDMTEAEEVPPPRPSTRPPPSRAASQAHHAQSAYEPSNSISSQWELPSIPSSSLEFGAENDLSLSWSEAEDEKEVQAPPPPPHDVEPSKRPSVDVQLSADDLMAIWGRVGVQVCEVATALFEKSRKSLIGDGTFAGFVHAVLREVPNASHIHGYGYIVYMQSGSSVQLRASDIMPGDVVEFYDAKLKGHKGLHTYSQTVGTGEPLIGVVGEFEPKKSKVKVFQANQHVGQQAVESVSYRLEDLKSGTVKVYRVLEA